MRLFVAVDLPEPVKQAVAGIRGDLPGARWVPTEQLHLTLRFIGEAEAATVRLITESLGRVRGAPFDLTMEEVGHFPPGRRPRVLWVGMAESAPLLDLQRQVEHALVTTGIPPEERQFSPHITIARLRETPAAPVLALEERHREFACEPFPVTEFHLYSSVLTPHGAIHTREATYPLALSAP